MINNTFFLINNNVYVTRQHCCTLSTPKFCFAPPVCTATFTILQCSNPNISSNSSIDAELGSSDFVATITTETFSNSSQTILKNTFASSKLSRLLESTTKNICSTPSLKFFQYERYSILPPTKEKKRTTYVLVY